MYNSCIQELKQINILRVLTLFEKNTTFFTKIILRTGQEKEIISFSRKLKKRNKIENTCEATIYRAG